MNEIKVFNNAEFGKIRTLNRDGEPWFVGKDVATALGYKDSVNALKSHVSEEDKGGWRTATQYGERVNRHGQIKCGMGVCTLINRERYCLFKCGDWSMQ